MTTVIGFQELKIKSFDTSIFNVAIKYILYNCLTKYINIIKYFRQYVDIDVDKLHVVKLFPDNKNAIILDTPPLNFKCLTHILNTSEIDDKMVNVIVMKFNLINDGESICLKSMISKYKDNKKIYANTIKNILLFNEIQYMDDSRLDIKLMKNKKMVTINVLLSDVENNHINYFLY